MTAVGDDKGDWRDRVVKERNKLSGKLGRLNRFLADDDNLTSLSNKTVALLIAQSYVMQQYLDILDRRLD